MASKMAMFAAVNEPQKMSAIVSDAPVVIVHGLWMGAWQMRPLKNALVRANFRCYRYHYASALAPYQQNQDGLARLIEERIGKPCHIVAHSMGGLLTLDLLARRPELCAGRVVCLGTPINGSQVIKKMQRAPFKTILGHASAPLLKGIAAGLQDLPETIKVSVLAGTRSLGGGKLLARFNAENDGSVGIEETQAEWLTHHERLNLSHTQLVYSSRAQARVVSLLRG